MLLAAGGAAGRPERYHASVPQIRELAIERIDGETRRTDRDRVVVEAPLQLRARGTPVATIMRTPGHDLELVRGLLHAESLGPAVLTQVEADAIEIDVAPDAFAGRGLLASAACGVGPSRDRRPRAARPRGRRRYLDRAGSPGS
jgi:formate dehydrogenase assembly factor FdhD